MHRTDDAQLTLGKTVGRPMRERRPGNVCIDNLRCSPIPVLNIFHNFRCLNKEVRLVPLSNIRVLERGHTGRIQKLAVRLCYIRVSGRFDRFLPIGAF
jgi:hypothetical protein